MAEEKKVKGQPFLQQFGRMLAGENQNLSPEEEAASIKKKTEAVKAQAEYATTVDQLTNPESVKKIVAERESELVSAAKEARQDAKEAEDRERQRLQKEKDEAEAAAAAEQARREEAENALREQGYNTLLAKIEELKTSQKPIAQQLSEYLGFFDTISEKFNLPKIGVKPPDTTTHQDPNLTLQLEKLRVEEAQKQREHEWKLAQDKKEWELKMLTFQREGVWHDQELARQARRDEQIFNFPQTIGAAIAKGLMESEAPPREVVVSSSPKLYRIELGEGEVGEFECPNCKSPVAVGPTSTDTQCVGCNTKFPITRKPKPAIQNQEE